MNIYMICTLWTPFQAERDWKNSYREILLIPLYIFYSLCLCQYAYIVRSVHFVNKEYKRCNTFNLTIDRNYFKLVWKPIEKKIVASSLVCNYIDVNVLGKCFDSFYFFLIFKVFYTTYIYFACLLLIPRKVGLWMLRITKNCFQNVWF